MIRLTIGEFEQQSWAAAIEGFRDLSLLQCWEYGNAREREGRWKVERGLLKDGDRVLGAAQIMVRRLPVIGGGLAWLSRGPLWRRDGSEPVEILGDALKALRQHYAEERGFYLRVAPAVEMEDPACSVFSPAGFETTGTAGWASSLVDLTRPAEELRSSLRGNWRNHLKRAERAEFTVEHGTDAAGFEACLEDYRALLSDRGFTTSVTSDLLAALQDALPDDRKLVYYRGLHDGAVLGSILLARYGECCEYLVNNIDPAGRRMHLGQLLLWRAICDMKQAGLKYFDLSGMDPDRTPKGIYDFKRGVGGAPYRLASEIEASKGGLRSRLVRWRVDRARADEAQ